MKKTPLLLAMSWLLISSPAQSDDDVIVLGGALSIAPTVIERKFPTYPRSARVQGAEGWVLVEVTVGIDGLPQGVHITASSIEEVFDQAALDATSEWLFKPATDEGVPVEAPYEIRHTFLLRGQQGSVSDSFFRQARGISGALAKDNLDKAWKNIEKLEKKRKRLLAESAYLNYYKAVYFEKMSDPEEALKQLNEALVVAKLGIDPSIYRQMLMSAIRLNARMGYLGSALARYRLLQDVPDSSAEQEAMHSLVSQIESLIESNQVLEIEATVKACETCVGADSYAWTHRPFRKQFTVPEVPDSIDEARLRCGDGIHYFQLESGKTYLIPELSDDCSLSVKGAKAESFIFLALPDKEQSVAMLP